MLAALVFARQYWKLAALAVLAMLLAVQTVRLGAANNRADRIQINLNEARAELKRISSKKNKQRTITVKKIKLVEIKRREADRIAEKIEQAPTAPNCATPSEIMGADL